VARDIPIIDHSLHIEDGNLNISFCSIIISVVPQIKYICFPLVEALNVVRGGTISPRLDEYFKITKPTFA
jgi:hypothetical protein